MTALSGGAWAVDLARTGRPGGSLAESRVLTDRQEGGWFPAMTENAPLALIAGVTVGGGAPVRIMGVLNASPESFYAGSVAVDPGLLRERACRFVEEGADFIDIGSKSTAPYLATEITEEEERRRMVAAVGAVAGAVAVPISADSIRATVVQAALDAGASIVNDVNGLRGDGIGAVAANAAGVVVMASPSPSVPSALGKRPIDVVEADLRVAIGRALDSGIAEERIVADPGIGFYTQTAWPPVEFNGAVLRDLRQLFVLGRPLLVGVSRKSFIGKLTGRESVDQRLAGSLAAAAIAVWNGAAIVRTHDVAATLDAVRVVRGLMCPGVQ